MNHRAFLAIIIFVSMVAAFTAPGRSQQTKTVTWPNPFWLPYNSGPMVTLNSTIYGPNPMSSECAFPTPSPQSTQVDTFANSQQTTGNNSWLDANSVTAVQGIWGTYPYPNATTSPAAASIYWGNGLGKLDITVGNDTYLGSIISAGKLGSGGYPTYVGVRSDPVFCVPYGPEQYTIAHPVMIHIPLHAWPEMDSDHHLCDIDTTSAIHFCGEEVGIVASALGTGGCGLPTVSSVIPWTGFPEGASPNPAVTASPPYGTPPPDGSIGSSDAYAPGVRTVVNAYGNSSGTVSAWTNEGLGSSAVAGGMSPEWADQPRDFLTSPFYPQHAAIFNGTCDTFTGSSADPHSGSYVYPVVINRSGFVTDNRLYCSSNTLGIIYGGHLWLDMQPDPSKRGQDGCSIIAWGLLMQLNMYGAYKNTIGGASVCNGNIGCSEGANGFGNSTQRWLRFFERQNESAM